MFDDQMHPDPNPKHRNLKYPLHFYGMTDSELKVVGVKRNASGELVDIPKKERVKKPKAPLMRKKKVVLPTDKGEVVEGLPVEELEFLESSLEELADRHRPEHNFFELANFQPKQMEAHEAVMRHKYILYGGAVGGGGPRRRRTPRTTWRLLRWCPPCGARAWRRRWCRRWQYT